MRDPLICSVRRAAPRMLHFVFLLLASSVYSCVRTTPSADTTLARTRLLESRAVVQQPVKQWTPAPIRGDVRSAIKAEQTSIKEHLALFRQASVKTFHTSDNKSYSKKEDPVKETTTATQKLKFLEKTPQKERDEEGSGDISTIKVSTVKSTSASPNSANNTKASQPEQCSCPRLFMDYNVPADKLCTNWKNVQDGFTLIMDPRYQVNDVLYASDKCSRSVTCEEPYMLVRWASSRICDVHSPEETKEEKPKFSYECNGTTWTMQNYPIDSIICARKKAV